MWQTLRSSTRAAAVKHACRDCETRRALFRYRGVVKWDRYHTLCFQCYRRYADRLRAASLASGPRRDSAPAPAPERRLAG